MSHHLSAKARTCIRCGQRKSLSEFYHHPQGRDGHAAHCKACHKAQIKATQQAHLRDIDHPTTRWVVKFWQKVQAGKSDECWEWQGRVGKNGYGVTYMHSHHLYAHRMAWVITNGPIEDGLHVLHKCDNPRCVNPDHLFLGTQADNNRDMHRKGRNAQPGGEDHHRSRLTWEDVHTIRRRHAEERVPNKELAEEYGVHLATITGVIANRTWHDEGYTPPAQRLTSRGVMNQHSKLTPEKVRAIRSAYASGKANQYELARTYGVHQTTIHSILQRRSWKHVS